MRKHTKFVRFNKTTINFQRTGILQLPRNTEQRYHSMTCKTFTKKKTKKKEILTSVGAFEPKTVEVVNSTNLPTEVRVPRQ